MVVEGIEVVEEVVVTTVLVEVEVVGTVLVEVEVVRIEVVELRAWQYPSLHSELAGHSRSQSHLSPRLQQGTGVKQSVQGHAPKPHSSKKPSQYWPSPQ